MLGYGVKETTTTTGTGTLTLTSVSGFPTFANAFSVGDLVEYSLLNSSGQPIETGVGIFGASNTLARTYPLVTWNGTDLYQSQPERFVVERHDYRDLHRNSRIERAIHSGDEHECYTRSSEFGAYVERQWRNL